MQNFLLLLAVIVTFIFGFFVMRKLDCFLEENFHSVITYPRSEAYDFRIGFSDPLLAESIADILEAFINGQNHTSIFLFSGTAEQLLRELSIHKLDVVFLSANIVVPKKYYDTLEVSLNYNPIITKYSGLVIEPIAKEEAPQKVLWDNSNETSIVVNFIKYLERREQKNEKA